jgi:translin
MINFTKIQKQIHDYDSERERLIKQSRVVLKLSKQVIYAVHRDEISSAAKLLKSMDKEKQALETIAKYNHRMLSEGSYKIAIQEYVEAVLYFNFVKTGKLSNLSVQPGHFVLGLADLPGELVRKAVFLAGKGEVDKVIKIKDEVDNIYGQLLKFDFRDNEIRRKVDAVKYDLRKLEDLVLDLKLKSKL